MGNNCYAQTDIEFVKAARVSWDNLNYAQTKDLYKSALEVNPESFDANLELGILHVEVYQNYKEGLYYFEQALGNMPNDTVYELFKFLGNSYHQMSSYPLAIENYQIFQKGIVKNEKLEEEIDLKIKQCEFAQTYDYILWDGKFKNMGPSMNSESSEYCSVLPMKDSFMLFTKRTSEKVDGKVSVIAWEEIYFSKNKNKEYHQSAYSEDLTDFEKLSTESNKHYSVVSVSSTGDTLVVYKDNGLWFSRYEGASWSTPEKFPKAINSGWNQRHGCFSSDGKKFYFSSKKMFSKTGYDLYLSEIDEEGNWGEGKLIDSTINTNGDEDSPFITKDGQRLYFASTGHMGYGGYDIFFCDKTETGWTTPKNAGRTVNSPGDDVFLNIVNDEDSTTMLSSCRPNGYGQMDIFYFYKYGQPKFDSCINVVDLIPSDTTWYTKDDIVCSGKDTLLIDELETYGPWESTLRSEFIHDVFFKYNDSILKEDSLTLVFDSLGVYQFMMEVLTRDSMDNEMRHCLVKDVYVVEPEKDKPEQRHVKDSNELALSFSSSITDDDMLPLPDGFKLELESIYFDFGKSYIRSDQKSVMEQNVKLIKANPDMIIKVIGHTDQVGSKEYNLKLSTKRAKSAVDYLISKGVSKNQIVAVLAEGEAGTRFKKEDGSDDIEKMEKSRRVDFYVIGKKK